MHTSKLLQIQSLMNINIELVLTENSVLPSRKSFRECFHIWGDIIQCDDKIFQFKEHANEN